MDIIKYNETKEDMNDIEAIKKLESINKLEAITKLEEKTNKKKIDREYKDLLWLTAC